MNGIDLSSILDMATMAAVNIPSVICVQADNRNQKMELIVILSNRDVVTFDMQEAERYENPFSNWRQKFRLVLDLCLVNN